MTKPNQSKILNSFQTKSTLTSGGKKYTFYDLKKIPAQYQVERLPYSLKILLENLLRTEDGVVVNKNDILGILKWAPNIVPIQEIAFTPSRVILQDFTGVPAVVDLAAMREAMAKLKGNPVKINPLSPVELVIDHSVMVDYSGSKDAFQKNVQMEFGRNEERYAFLRWGQTAFQNFRVVPPGTGIVHQVNLEYLARVIFAEKANKDGHGIDKTEAGEIADKTVTTDATDETIAYPDSLVGTDSHTTMINGLGVLGWGVGGIEAEAAMLGQPITMLIPEVVGFKITGKLTEGTTATDLVLTVVEMLRRKKVVGKFVEFYGDGLESLTIADRATIANMAPEYGATCGIFPIDNETLSYLRLSGRSDTVIQLVEDYAKAQGMFREKGSKEAQYSDSLTLDLSSVIPCIAGPKRPQDRIPLKESKFRFNQLLEEQKILPTKIKFMEKNELSHGAVVIAAITSCTNTSNPDVMIASGLIAKKAQALGLKPKPWVKTSFAPGSQVVSDYMEKAGLMDPLNSIGFDLVGYGCTTCIGNSGPLLPAVSQAIKEGNLSVAAVLSGNRNFEGRIHPDVRFAYLASPPLVVIYALTGTMNIDLYNDAIAYDQKGNPVKFSDLWPSNREIQEVLQKYLHDEMFTKRYAHVFTGDKRWQDLQIPKGNLFSWDENSTYVKNPPFFDNMSSTKPAIQNIENARVLALLGDSVTTDHISPAGDIDRQSPAGKYLESMGVTPSEFNSYGSRRGNHEVMMRGTFANIRLRNLLVEGQEGNWTIHLPSGDKMSIYDAAMRYQQESCPLIIIAGKEYGTGSSRDWAAKGTRLLGVRAVIAETFERIHRSNLIGMGVLPLEFLPGEDAKGFGLTGHEFYSLNLEGLKQSQLVQVNVKDSKGAIKQFNAKVRIDTPKELEYFQHGGILHFVLRNLAA